MRDGEIDGAEEIVGWPDYHFAGHRKRFAEFDAPALRALLALRTTAQRVENAVGSWLLDAGLTPQKFGVLIVLHAEGKPISLSELRRYLGTTQANVTGLVTGLERDGYIERKASTVDRRVTFVSLSRSGKRVVTSMMPTYFAHNKAAMKTLTQNEKKTLVDLLAKISRGFGTEHHKALTLEDVA
jgi:DNA-binding MarR family transcriptional regulator